jgi:sensor c-di-GMP phosphodiesterase-like protein
MFVDTIASDDLKGTVLESMISFARESQLGMIAEGVEEQNQVSYLQERNVFLIQGYVYAKPMPIEEFVDWVKQAH